MMLSALLAIYSASICMQAFPVDGGVKESQKPGDLLNDAISRRYVASDYHVRIRITSDGQLAGCWEVQISGEKEKSVFHPTEFLDDTSDGSDTITLCSNCFEINAISRFQATSAQGALAIYDTTLLAPSLAWIPDPRRIGLTPTDIFVEHGVHADDYYSADIKNRLLVSTESVDGKSLVRLTCIDDYSDLDIWIDESESNSIVKCRLSLKGDNLGQVYEVQNSYVNLNSHWVLGSSKYTEVNSTRTREVLTQFEWMSVGALIPEKEFELTAVPGLKVGDNVFWVMPEDRPSPLNGQMIWDGAKLINAPGAHIATEPLLSESAVGKQRSRWLIWLNFLGFSLVVLWYFLRRSNRSKRADRN
jgi:hypothetical protein